jgi:tetrameric-type glycyl-tRNA synthetase beta subunit
MSGSRTVPSLLLEIGCEELPAAACREALAQLPGLVEQELGLAPAHVFAGPRRLAVIAEDIPAEPPEKWVKGPPVGAPEQARAGFARRHGLPVDELEERDGFLGTPVPGKPLADRVSAIVDGLSFSKSMCWEPGGRRFARPVRWVLALLDSEEVEGRITYGHRFTHDLAIGVPDAGAYLGLLRNAGVEPDQAERRRLIVDGLDALGGWEDPSGVLEEVVHLAESPIVIGAAFDERFLELPERVIVAAMQSHQRYFPLGGNGFAVVANGGDPELVRAGHENVLDNRLEDAEFTFRRDLARGIDSMAASLGSITFFAGAGSYAEKTERLVELVERLGGDDVARQAARLAKADQASELMREFPDLEGAVGAEYARRAGYAEDVCVAIEDHFLPDGADAPLPQTPAGKILSAADKLDTLTVSFELGHKPTGSRDPFGLRRAAIGLCRLAVEGGLPITIDDSEVRDFVEERLEGYLDVPVEFVRAARASELKEIGTVVGLAEYIAGRDLAAVHEVYTRASRIVGDLADDRPIDEAMLVEPAEQELARALQAQPEVGARYDRIFEWAASLAPVVERFFVDVLVMDPDENLRANRLRLLRDLRDSVGRLGDLSQIPL